MEFEIGNETDVFVLASMISAFQKAGVEYNVKRVRTYETGEDRDNIRLIV